jgi:sugar lactone lactonase YvrE
MKTIILKAAFLLGAIATLLPTRIHANPGDIFVSDACAHIYQFAPNGSVTVFASGLNGPRGLTFDNAGNLYAAIYGDDGTGDGMVVKFVNGVQSIVATNLGNPEGIAFDSFGNLYVADVYGALYKIAPNGAVNTVFIVPNYTPGTFQGHQFFGVAVDKKNNVYLTDGVPSNGTVWKFTPQGAMSVFASNIQPIGLTIRNGNNLFVSTVYEDGDGSNGADIPGGGKIIQIAPSGAQTVVASGLGDLDLRGIGLDHFGNFYVTDHAFGNHGNPCCFNYRRIYDNVLKVTNGTATIFASIADPSFSCALEFLTIQP